jgi:hypothetical protein
MDALKREGIAAVDRTGTSIVTGRWACWRIRLGSVAGHRLKVLRLSGIFCLSGVFCLNGLSGVFCRNGVLLCPSGVPAGGVAALPAT